MNFPNTRWLYTTTDRSCACSPRCFPGASSTPSTSTYSEPHHPSGNKGFTFTIACILLLFIVQLAETINGDFEPSWFEVQAQMW